MLVDVVRVLVRLLFDLLIGKGSAGKYFCKIVPKLSKIIRIVCYQRQLPLGAGVIWTFSDVGLVVPASSSIVLWNLGTNAAIQWYFEWDE